jgi:hypothetical protein
VGQLIRILLRLESFQDLYEVRLVVSGAGAVARSAD